MLIEYGSITLTMITPIFTDSSEDLRHKSGPGLRKVPRTFEDLFVHFLLWVAQHWQVVCDGTE